MEDEEEHVTVEWALEGEHEEDEEASASGHERDGICSDREGDGRDGGVNTPTTPTPWPWPCSIVLWHLKMRETGSVPRKNPARSVGEKKQDSNICLARRPPSAQTGERPRQR